MIKVLSGRQFPVTVIPLIEKAKNSIDIIVFDWRWYGADPGASVQLFNQAIHRSVKRKVKVRALVNSAGLVNFLKREGIHGKHVICQKLMHCKMMIIDGKTVITGSHNYTKSAFHLNIELSVLIEDDPSIPEFIQFYNNIWQR